MKKKSDIRYGFTTGSCAAAAAKASAIMLLGDRVLDHISIAVPSGDTFTAKLHDISRSDGVICAVRKPESDDPDVTAGIYIYAKSKRIPDGKQQVVITGGRGIGKVTKPGLDRPVGDAAINTVPRAMIEREVRDVMEQFECFDSIGIEISAPEGEEIAAGTFNPRLGIEGGISIIGTSGIVEPMSTRAILDTIKVELRQKKELGSSVAVVSPGNYGLEFMKERFGYDLDMAVKCSNYIGETIDIARETGYGKMLLVGHLGKLIKISGGIMNTHSKEADCRMELMAAAAARSGADVTVINRILDCATTEEAHKCILDAGVEKGTYAYIMDRIGYYLRTRAEDMQIECILFTNRYGLLGMTEHAEEFI